MGHSVGGHTVPSGYPEDLSSYADESEVLFPVDEHHVRAAVSLFGKHHFPNAGVRRRTAKRILSAARKHSIEVSEDSEVYRAAHESGE